VSSRSGVCWGLRSAAPECRRRRRPRTAISRRSPWSSSGCGPPVDSKADGTGSKSVGGRVSIRNDTGLKAFGQIAGSYDAGFETLTIKGRVVKPDGVATEIPQSAVQDVSSPVLRMAPIYGDIREKHLVVPGLGVGDILEYEMQLVRLAAFRR
jgi:hypothetical protein